MIDIYNFATKESISTKEKRKTKKEEITKERKEEIME